MKFTWAKPQSGLALKRSFKARPPPGLAAAAMPQASRAMALQQGKRNVCPWRQ